ncbi:helix-turn-helix domain-containing protein [Lacihabitans lacunae]|uniref:Helix-turn-helix domain-containing protein n=1 Tax=Lacihabitans lacunae TaxID=1028214 RepID=A0ABV7YS03_9BACT
MNNRQSHQAENSYPEILTRQQAADLLSINLSTLWAWTKSKKLTAYGVGNRVYYKYSEIINKNLTPLN